jgi:hypothetical protein
LPAFASLKKLVGSVVRGTLEITTPLVVTSSVTTISLPSGDQSHAASVMSKFRLGDSDVKPLPSAG